MIDVVLPQDEALYRSLIRRAEQHSGIAESASCMFSADGELCFLGLLRPKHEATELRAMPAIGEDKASA